MQRPSFAAYAVFLPPALCHPLLLFLRALYESKNGEQGMRRAVRLLQRAVALDHSAIGALRWSHFRQYVRSYNPLARPPTRGLRSRSALDLDDEYGI